MKKNILKSVVIATAVLVSLSSVSFAQEESGIKSVINDLSYGAELSLVMPQVSGEYEYEEGIGFSVEGSAAYEVNETIELELGLGLESISYDETEGSTETEVSMLWLTVPAVASYELPLEIEGYTFSVSGGGFVSYLLSSDEKKDTISDSDFGLTFGASVAMASPVSYFESVSLSLGYNLGLKELSESEELDIASFEIGLGAEF